MRIARDPPAGLEVDLRGVGALRNHIGFIETDFAPTGPLGIIHPRDDAKSPYFGALGRSAVYPAYHVVSGLARAAGARVVVSTSSDNARVRSLAYRAKDATLLWLANMTAQDQWVSVAHTGVGPFGIVLDEASFEQASTKPAAFEAKIKPLDTRRLLLRAYAVALICIPGR